MEPEALESTTESVSEDTGVEESLEESLENTTEDLQEADDESYDSNDLALMSNEELENLEKRASGELEETDSEEEEPSQDLKQEEVTKAEPDPESQVEAEPDDQTRNEPSDDPQLNQTLTQMGERLGELEKYNQQLIHTFNHLRQQAEEISEDDPRKAAELDRQMDEIRTRVQETQTEYQKVSTYQNNLKIVPKHVPQEALDLEVMSSHLQREGVTKEQADHYVRNMMSEAKPSEIIHLAQAAQMAKKWNETIPYIEQLRKENEELKAKLGTGGAKKSKSPDQVAKMINKSKKLPKPMTPAPTTDQDDLSVTSKDLALMSDEEFNAFYERTMNNGKI